MPAVILFGYPRSPYTRKIDYVLQLKNIPHYTVEVPMVPPRADLLSLGVGYRRIPALLCDRDMYCDTRLIAPALDSLFPSAQGFPSIFPPRNNNAGSNDNVLISVFATNYAEANISRLVASLLAWEVFPPEMVQDRSRLFGAPLNVEGMVASRPANISRLLVHLQTIESQLQDGREWLFDTIFPSLADISVYFIFTWVRSFKHLNPDMLFSPDQFPHLTKWASRMTQRLESSPKTATPLQGDQVPQLLADNTTPLKPQATPTHFDTEEGDRLGVKFGDEVSVAPEDTGRDHPTTGRLISLTSVESVIEIEGKAGLLRCHFPRLGFGISPISKL